VLRGVGAVCLTSTLAACTVPGQGPPPDLFRLTPKSTFDEDLPSVDWQLVIETPVAPAVLGGPRIVLTRAGTKVEYYARSNWTDRAPDMIHTLVIESFQNSGRIVAVGRANSGLRSDYLLKLGLRELEARYPVSGPPSVHVRLNALLVDMPERQVIGHAEFESDIPAAVDSMPVIVEAFDEALGKVLKRLVKFTLVTAEQDWQVERRERRRS